MSNHDVWLVCALFMVITIQAGANAIYIGSHISDTCGEVAP